MHVKKISNAVKNSKKKKFLNINARDITSQCQSQQFQWKKSRQKKSESKGKVYDIFCVLFINKSAVFVVIIYITA